MDYKSAFYILLLVFFVSMGVSLWVIRDVHKSLDIIDQYIVDDKITKYQKAGWMPKEIKRNRPEIIPHKKSKKKETKNEI